MTVYTMLIQATCERLPIADNSIDLIFTDPPYPKEYLPCYAWLAREAARALKPRGFVVVICGGLFLNQIYRFFDNAGLDYFYEMQRKSTNSNGTTPVVWKHYEDKQAVPIVAMTKPIIVYSKMCGRPRMGNVCNLVEHSGAWSKQFHHWGQDTETARYYIDYFSSKGDLVLDPFIGGGTTAVACELIGRRWIGCDIDPAALVTTAQRLSGAMIPQQGKMLPLFE